MTYSMEANCLPPCFIREVVTKKLDNTLDMIVKLVSVGTMIPDYEPYDTIADEIIQEIEIFVFKLLKKEYSRFSSYLFRSVERDHLDICSKITGNPLFLYPTVVQEGHDKHEIIPISSFTETWSYSILHHVLDVSCTNNIYKPAYCGGLLISYPVDCGNHIYVKPRSNCLIAILKLEDDTGILTCLERKFVINASTMLAADALKTIYHPIHTKALERMAHKDQNMLCFQIDGHHPIDYICTIFEDSESCRVTQGYVHWFNLIISYLQISMWYYPRESGFLFVNAYNGVPVILRIIRRYEELGIHSIPSWGGIQSIINACDYMQDPTGLFHNLLLYSCVHFSQFVRNVCNKGDYIFNHPLYGNVSLMTCFLERRMDYFEEGSFNEVDTLYLIFRTWPESIMSSLPNENTNKSENEM